MALRCQGTLFMLADTSGKGGLLAPKKKKGLITGLFNGKKQEDPRLWVKRKLVLTDESLRFFRPASLKYDVNDPTPYDIQHASDKIFTRVIHFSASSC